MKRRIYKRYRTRKRGGQRYWVGRRRRNYGSKLKFDKPFKSKEEGSMVTGIHYKDGQATIHEFPDFIGISNLYVKDKGRGTGTKMMKRVIEDIQEKHPDKPILGYPESKLSRKFLKKLGFEDKGTMVELK